MIKCVNIKSPEFVALHKEVGGSVNVLKSKIGVWQTKNNTDEFPSLETVRELMKPPKEIVKHDELEKLKSKPEFQQAVKEAFEESEELQDTIYETLGVKRNVVDSNKEFKRIIDDFENEDLKRIAELFYNRVIKNRRFLLKLQDSINPTFGQAIGFIEDNKIATNIVVNDMRYLAKIATNEFDKEFYKNHGFQETFLHEEIHRYTSNILKVYNHYFEQTQDENEAIKYLREYYGERLDNTNFEKEIEFIKELNILHKIYKENGGTFNNIEFITYGLTHESEIIKIKSIKVGKDTLLKRMIDALFNLFSNPSLYDALYDTFANYYNNFDVSKYKEYTDTVRLKFTPLNENSYTQQALDLYTDYIARISLGLEVNPMTGEYNDSVVEDVVYHGTTEFEGDRFDKEKLASLTGDGTASAGFHFSNKQTAIKFGIPSRIKTGKDIFTIPVVLNMKSVEYMEDVTELRGKIGSFIEPSDKVRELIDNGRDSILIKSYQGGSDYIVFSPDQILIINGKDAIRGFKEYVENKVLNSEETELTPIKDKNIVPYQDSVSIAQARHEVARLIGSNAAAFGLRTNPNLTANTGEEAYGRLRDSIITLRNQGENVSRRAARHESMHYILDYSLSQEEHRKVVESAKTIVKSQRKVEDVTDIDALEYLCDTFEGYKDQDMMPGDSIISRVINFIKRLFSSLARAEYEVNNLFYKAEKGVYASNEAHIYDNNPNKLDRYSKAASNEYHKSESIEKLMDLYEGVTEEVFYQKDDKSLMMGWYAMTGKRFHPKHNDRRFVEELYKNLTDTVNILDVGNAQVVYNGETKTLQSFYNDGMILELLENYEDVTISNIDNHFKSIYTWDNTYKDTEDKVGDILFAYNLMQTTLDKPVGTEGEVIKGTKEYIYTFLSMLAPDMDVRAIARGESRNMGYDTSYSETTNVTDNTNTSFKNVIHSITFTPKGAKYEHRVTWNDFVKEMVFLAEVFRTRNHPAGKTEGASVKMIGEFQYNSSQTISNLSYEDILAYMRIGKRYHNSSAVTAIYNAFKIEGRAKANVDEEVVFNEKTNEYYFEFSKLGYGAIINRINEYLDENSKTNKDFKAKIKYNENRELYNEAIQMLKERKVYIQSNIVNYLVNYANSVIQRDKMVFETDGKVVNKILRKDTAHHGGVYEIAYLSMFDRVESNERPDGLGTIATSIMGDYHYQNYSKEDIDTDKSKQRTAALKDINVIVGEDIEIDRSKDSYTFREFNALYDILNRYYADRLDKDALMQELNITTGSDEQFIKTSEYMKFEEEAFDVMQAIYENYIILEKGVEGNLRTAVGDIFMEIGKLKPMNTVDTMRNADGGIVSSLTTISPFLKEFKHGTDGIKERYVRTFSGMDENLKAIKEKFVSIFTPAVVFELSEIKEMGGLKNNLYGRNWEDLSIEDRMYSFFTVLHGDKANRFGLEFYPVLLNETGDRKTIYSATMRTNVFFKDKINSMPMVKEKVAQAVKNHIAYNEHMYKQSQVRINEVLKSEDNVSKIKIEGGKFVATIDGAETPIGFNPTNVTQEVDKETGKPKIIFTGLSPEAKYIEHNLKRNVDYVIKNGEYIIGNAGRDAIFGVDAVKNYGKELVTDEDYVNFFKESADKDLEKFEELIKEKDYKHPAWMLRYSKQGDDVSKVATDLEAIKTRRREIYDTLNEAEKLLKKEERKTDEGITFKGKEYTVKQFKTLINKINKEYRGANSDYYKARRATSNDYMRAYFYTHILVNQGIADYMNGGIAFAKNAEDYMKRTGGETSPKEAVAGNNPSERFLNRERQNLTEDLPMIGKTQRYVVLQDIPGYNFVYHDKIDDELHTNGIVYMPYFYAIALRNSAGTDMSYIGNGAIKTSNYHHDIVNNHLLYMKSSEMPISEMMYKTKFGEEMYKAMLSHPVRIKEGESFKELNPYDEFREIYENESSGRNRYFEANKKFLDYIYTTMTYNEDGTEAGVIWNRIAHKAMFQSAVKQGQYKVNHWTHHGEHDFRFNVPSSSIQEVSNDNYGLQTNKLQPTDHQRKKVLTQPQKIMGAYEHNIPVKKKMDKAVMYAIEAYADRLNLGNYNIAGLKSMLYNGLAYNYNPKIETILNNNIPLELIKKEALNKIVTLINNALSPETNGNIYVQHPAFTYVTEKGTEERLNPFRYYKKTENGLEEIISRKELEEAVNGKIDLQVGMQEAIMAFPFKDEFGITSGMTIEEAFRFGNNDFNVTSSDFTLDKKGNLIMVESKANQIRDAIAKTIAKIFLVEDNKIITLTHSPDTKIGHAMQKQIYMRSLLKNLGVANPIVDAMVERAFNEKEVVDAIFNYYIDLNKACNFYAPRIPFTNTNMGFPTRIVQFDDNIENTMVTSAEKSILDGSDYDIDELNVIFSSFGRIETDENGNLTPEGKIETFKRMYHEALMSYYYDINNRKQILSRITTRNIAQTVEKLYKGEGKGNLNTPTNTIYGYDEAQQGDQLISRFVRSQTTVTEAISILNQVADEEIKKKYPLYTNNNIKGWYLDVMSELINAATDNLSLGNAIGKMGININNSNIASGLAFNLSHSAIYDFMFEKYKEERIEASKDKSIEVTKAEFEEVYGVRKVKVKDGFIVERNEDNPDAASRYFFEALFHIMQFEQVKEATQDVVDSRRVINKSKSSKIHQTINAGDSNLENLIQESAYMGEAIFTFSTLFNTDYRSNHDELFNEIQRMGIALRIVENTEKGVIKQSLVESILAFIQAVKRERKGEAIETTTEEQSVVESQGTAQETQEGETSETTPEQEQQTAKKPETEVMVKEASDKDISNRYGIPSQTVEKIHELLPMRRIAKESDLLLAKLEIVLKAYQEYLSNFPSERLIDAVKQRLYHDNKLQVLFENDARVLRGEINEAIVGNLIRASKDEDVTVNIKKEDETHIYNFKNSNYPLLILDFVDVIKDMKKNVFANENLFLNSLVKSPIKDTFYYGIEGIKHFDESLRLKYKQSYDEVYNLAMKHNDKSLNGKERENAEKAYNFLKALELINLMTQGFEGNSLDISVISNLHFTNIIMENMDKVDDMMEKEREAILQGNTLFYNHVVTRAGKASPAIVSRRTDVTDFDFGYTKKNQFDYQNDAPFLAMSTREGMAFKPTTFVQQEIAKDEKGEEVKGFNFYGTPFGDSYNMYAVNVDNSLANEENERLNIPLVRGEKTKVLKRVSDTVMKKALAKETIIIKGKEVIYEMLGSKVENTIKQNDIVNIWGESYKAVEIMPDYSDNKNSIAVFEYVKTSQEERQNALDTRKERIANIATKEKIFVFFNHIQKVFPNIQIEYIHGEHADFAYVENGVIYFNLDKVSADMTIHEFAHVFTMMVKSINPKAYNAIANEVRRLINEDAPIVRHVRSLYGDLSEEQMIFEVIGNTIQNTYGDAVEAILQRTDATDVERTAFEGFIDKVKKFFAKVGEILTRIFKGDWTTMETMTINQMGDILLNAMQKGEALSYLSSEEIMSFNYDKLNAVGTTPINNSADLLSNLKEYTNKYQGKPIAEVEEMIYQDILKEGYMFTVGNTRYDFTDATDEEIRKKIKERIASKVTNNMDFERRAIANGLNAGLDSVRQHLGTNASPKLNLSEHVRNSLGYSEANTHLYSPVSAERIVSIFRPDATKTYHLLDELINTKDKKLKERLGKYADAFNTVSDLIGYNPIISIEYVSDKEMVISIYDVISTEHNHVDELGVKNILYKYGIDEREARREGITLKNEEFDIRSLLITALTNELQKHDIKVYNASVVKIRKGNDSDAVLTKAVDMHTVRRNIKAMRNVEAFMGSINSKTIKGLFATEEGRITYPELPYMEMLSSLYHYYYYTKDKDYDPENPIYIYDPIVRDNFEKLQQGKLLIEDQKNLVAWRLRHLSNIIDAHKDEYYYNEMRLLKALDEQYNDMGHSKKVFTNQSMIDSMTRFYNVFDLNNEEIQYVHKLLVNASDITIAQVRKNKDAMKDVWEHFRKEYGGTRQFVSNPYFMFENMIATETVEGKEVQMGRIYWTLDESKDSYAKQAKDKISKGIITAEDVKMGDRIIDMIEKIFIKVLKHEQWMRYGTEKVRVQRGNTITYETLTDKEWEERLYTRGYKRGMIPIMPKTYIDSAGALIKRVGLEFNRESNEYQEGTPDLFDSSSGTKAVDELSNIFLNQLSAVEIDMELQKDPNNKNIIFDNHYGYLRRLSMLGLTYDKKTGELSLTSGKGERINKNLNVNLEQVVTFFDLSITRKRVYERTAIPQINSALKLIEFGRLFSLDPNNNKNVAQSIRDMCDMMITGSSYNIKNFGKNVFGTKSFGEVATTMSRGLQTTQMFLNVNIALLSGMINLIKTSIESLSGDKFMGKHAGKAMRMVIANPNRYLNLGVDYHLIRMREADLYGAGRGGSVTNQSMFVSFKSAYLSWITDAVTRVSMVVNRMLTDGNIDALTYDKETGKHAYDDTKDIRFFNSDGTQTEKQKALHQEMIEKHKVQEIDIRVDKKGNEHLTQPYDWAELNAMKEYADKRMIGAMDKRTQTFLSNYALGRLVMPYFSWFPAAWGSMFKSRMEHESIFKYEFDEVSGEVKKVLYQSEGMLRGLYNVASRAIRDRDFSYWRNEMTPELQRNLLRRLALTLTFFGAIKILFRLFTYDDDDEDKDRWWGVLPRTRLLRNIDYAADGLFAFVYADVLQRLKTPSPMLDAALRIFDDPKNIITTVGIGTDINTFMEVATGETLKQKIGDAMKD